MRIVSLFVLLVSLSSCNSNNSPTDPIGDETPAPSGGTGGLAKQTSVFGVRIVASASTSDAKVLHAASVMAEYLDNDEDGAPDNQAVVDAMVSANAYLVMFRNEAEQSAFSGPLPFGEGQNLFDEETIPNGAARGRFDATLEEVLHLITHVGYASVYPDVFGETSGSELARAMDVARGGHFETVPSTYPAGAWYTYDDPTCDYRCMVTEYSYWALTSILGAQEFPGRLDEIENEWRLNTRSKVEATDPTVFALLTDPQYRFPTILPDGEYLGFPIALE